MPKRDSKKGKAESELPSYYPKCETAALIHAGHFSDQIQKVRGQYLRNDDGSLHVIIGGKRIALKNDPDNHDLNSLFLTVCNITTVTQTAKVAIQRIQVEAHRKASSMRLRKFSAMSEDRSKLYVPVHGGKLMIIAAEGISQADNGRNADSLWVEHPEGAPFDYSSGNPEVGLRHFEPLLVDTQACLHPAMRWFVAMQEGLFPYVRELCPARFITVHIGPSQQGKTTGAKRFTILHGLGDVKGDYSVPALASLGDIGLLTLDNKEQANFSHLIDFLLYLATGAERGRAKKDGTLRRGASRPVGVITTIEGVYKAELHNRCVQVQYRIAGHEIGRDGIEREIHQRRNEICSAMMAVLQRYQQIRSEARPATPDPIPNFSENFAALCDLLRAYGQVAGKPAEWSQRIIESWNRILQRKEADEDELEHPILWAFHEWHPDEIGWNDAQITFEGRRGRLVYGSCSLLLAALRKLNLRDCQLPRTGQALGRRLRSGKYQAFQVLDEESAPELAMLKRTAERRGPVGIFFPDDSMTVARLQSAPAVIAQPSVN